MLHLWSTFLLIKRSKAWNRNNTHLLLVDLLYADAVNGVFFPEENIFSIIAIICLFTSSADVLNEVHQIKGNA